MKRTYTKEKLQKYKFVTLRNTFITLIGYFIPVSTAYLGRFMGFTDVPYKIIHYIGLYIVLTVLIFALIIYMKKEVTPYYSQLISLAMFFNFLIVAIICFMLLQQIRIALLTCTLIPLIFFFSVGNLISSVFIVIILLAAYLFAAHNSGADLGYGIGFKYDIVICIGFLISSSSLIAIAQQFRLQKNSLRCLRREAETAGGEMQESILSLKKANDTIQSLIEEIASQAIFVANEAHQVTNAGLSLADDSVKQANEINDVAEKMRHISDKTNTTTESTVQVDELVSEARTLSGKGVEQMNEMSSAMEEMSVSGKSIVEIIGTIDDIAFQTNLLALNAAIEASKAGRHGKGFAVVAQEVRTLASRSADAASVTAQLIEQSIQKVEKGTELSEQSTQALDKINNTISDVVKLVEEIAVATRLQRDEILNVNKVLETISGITDSNTQSARQTGQAAAKLSETATTIQTLLSTFN